MSIFGKRTKVIEGSTNGMSEVTIANINTVTSVAIKTCNASYESDGTESES